MLEKIWAIWITGVLQPSLPHDILLDLGLTERPAMVTRTLDLYTQRSDLAAQVQAPGTRLIDVFDRLDRALLILGAPGAGKTTLLLTLARDLLIRVAQDPEQPIPVVFPLSSWAQQQRPLAAWLVDALNEQYDIPRKIGQAWIEADHVLPLLDGLDEVAPEHRAACIEAINTFRQDHGLLPLVVCSRVADYEALGIRLRLQGAVVVQPLTPLQVESYLTQVGVPLTGVRHALQEDPAIGELLDTPLMLYVVTLAYAGRSVDALRTWETPDERLYLFAAYVERMFQRRSAITDYTRQEAERWLAWLAWQLTQHNQTVFYLERMQPDWLPGGQSWVPIHAARLMASLLGGLVMGLLGWQAGGLHVRLAWGYHPGSESEIELGWGLLGGLVGGLVGIQAGYAKEITTIETVRWSWSGFLTELFLPSGGRLVRGWAVGLLGGLFIGLGQGLDVTFAAVKDSKLTHWEAWWSDGLSYGLKGGMGVWFGVILVSGLGAILGFGLGSGLSWGLGSGLSFEVAGGLTLGLLIGLVYKLSSGFVAGLSGSEITTKTTPNEGIHRSARMALISGVGSGLAGGVISGLVIGLANVVLSGLSLGLLSELTQGVHYGLRRGLVYGLIFGLICGVISGLTAGIRYGGRTCVQHLLLRLMLRYNSLAPWQYVNFLDYAVERILLRKVGGGYMFIHRRLQEYFAARHVEPGGGSGAAAS